MHRDTGTGIGTRIFNLLVLITLLILILITLLNNKVYIPYGYPIKTPLM